MNEDIAGMLSERLGDAVSTLYGFERRAIEFVSYSQNYVFRVRDNGSQLIARVTEPDHRTREEIVSELNWIAFLKASGLSVCGAIQTNGRDICESIQFDGTDYSCVLFEHAPGSPITGTDLTPELFAQHGAMLGQLHRLTMDYAPPANFHRPQWYESRLYSRDANEFLLPEQPQVVQVLRELVEKGMALPKQDNAFGLVHLDVHYNNFFIESGSPHLFDFDNCFHGFLANDIAKALHASMFTYHRRKERFDDSPFESPLVDEALAAVWIPFWKGYRSARKPEPEIFETLPLFFMLVDITDYVHAHRHGIPERDPRIKVAFRKQRDRIEKGILPVQFDFTGGKPLS
jgi:Ser/Thr protein kinase RdoA (MazF antagonist)